MRVFKKSYDGGAGSGVTGYWLIEAKCLFSVVLIHFRPSTREAFHSHAFHAVTLWLKGRVREHHVWGEAKEFHAGQLKLTPRSCFHKVEVLEDAWALSIRGPWSDHWYEWLGDKFVTLTHSRKVISESPCI
jgi:hypothetical protein